MLASTVPAFLRLQRLRLRLPPVLLSNSCAIAILTMPDICTSNSCKGMSFHNGESLLDADCE